MQKFRLAVQTKGGNHFSNRLDLVQVVRAQRLAREVLHGAEVVILADTKSLRKEFAEVDARAEVEERKLPCPTGTIRHAVCWNLPLLVEAQEGCECPQCQMIRQACRQEEEHPEFAFPNVDHCGLLVEDEDCPGSVSDVVKPCNCEELPATIKMTVKPRQPTLVGRLMDLACWFIGVEPGL